MWAGSLSRCKDDNLQAGEKGTCVLTIHNFTIMEYQVYFQNKCYYYALSFILVYETVNKDSWRMEVRYGVFVVSFLFCLEAAFFVVFPWHSSPMSFQRAKDTNITNSFNKFEMLLSYLFSLLYWQQLPPLWQYQHRMESELGYHTFPFLFLHTYSVLCHFC